MLKLRLWARGLVVSLVYVLDVLGLQPYRGNIGKLRQVASLDVEPSLPLLQTYGAHHLNSSSNIKTGSSGQIEKSAAHRSGRAGSRPELLVQHVDGLTEVCLGQICLDGPEIW